MTPLVVVISVLGLTGVWLVGRRWHVRRLARDRMFDADIASPIDLEHEEDNSGPLRRWLDLAGYRDPTAPTAFVVATLALVSVAGLIAGVAVGSGAIQQSARILARLPAGLGDVLVPLLYAAPWIAMIVLGAIPWLLVRSARRTRVTQTEEDLPITLELLATLGEAGLGFDAALDRILATQPANRPLAEELRYYQVELLAGRPRVTCLRRLSDRTRVPSLTVLISALVQADQIGAGIADVLRRQSDDLRNSRRERALALAATLPVKLLFPLVICFLPGILVFTLGPAMFQVFQLLDGLFQNRGGLP